MQGARASMVAYLFRRCVEGEERMKSGKRYSVINEHADNALCACVCTDICVCTCEAYHLFTLSYIGMNQGDSLFLFFNYVLSSV